MKLKFTPLFIAVIISIATITACTKGTQGPAGTANVIYSNWDTLKYSWKDTNLISSIGNALYNQIDVLLIDSNILKKSDVKVFMKGGLNDNDSNIYILPRIYQGTDITNFVLNTKKIILYNQIVGQNQSPGGPWNQSAQFRYIIIPGSVLATARTQQESYPDLCKRLGIPE